MDCCGVEDGGAFDFLYKALSTPCRCRVFQGEAAEGANCFSIYLYNAFAFRASCEVDRTGEAALLPEILLLLLLLLLRILLLRLLVLVSLLRIELDPLRCLCGSCFCGCECGCFCEFGGGGGARLFAAKTGKRTLDADEF